MRELLKKLPQLKKTVEYLLNRQNPDGTYYTLNPDPISSLFFLGMMNELKIKPNNNTANWVRSLQTGKRGFGETTGENSWDYTTYWGSEMHKFAGLKPKFENNIVNFIKSHQNPDGGFGQVQNSNSNLLSTINWSLALLNLGHEPANKKGLKDYLLASIRNGRFGLEILYKILTILKKLNCNFDGEIEKNVLFRLRSYYRDMPEFMKYPDIKYFERSILKMFGKEVEDWDVKIRPYKKPKFAYYNLKLNNFFNKKIDSKTKKGLINYVKKNEMSEGGFGNQIDPNTHIAYCCVMGLDALGQEIREKEKLVLWLKYCQNEDGGFSYKPNGSSSEKATYWTLKILEKLKSLNIINKEHLLKFLNHRIEIVNPFMSYYLTGICEVMDILPHNYEQIIDGLLEFQGVDGGFAPVRGGKSEMYEAFRVVNTFNSIENIVKKRGIDHENPLEKISESLTGWILSCEREEGGFSWVPNERSYTQPTYHAAEVLNILGKDVDLRHVYWLMKFQNEDGGFNGGEIGTPSDAHFSFWALKTIKNILNE
ncbi:MAG: hypothetical protein J7J92_02415 [Candidatus Aenigmarchaeota archaeon]|nr:hypothetical protein [Candidatus Aenigmarchaeota archaeon]